MSESLISQEKQETDRNDKKQNLLAIILDSLSSTICLLCIFFIETINLMYMGYTDRPDFNLNIIGVGNIYLNFIGILIAFGMLGALDTMGSSCYGSNRLDLIGIYTIRSRIILNGLFFICTLPFVLYSTYILKYLNIDAIVADNVSLYMIYMLPSILLTFNYNLNVRYLQVLHNYLVPSVITILSVVLQYILCYIFIIQMDLLYFGLGLASFLIMLFNFVSSSIYIIYFDKHKESFIFYKSDVLKFKEFFYYIKLSIYSGVQHYGDYIGYEIVCFMCSYLKPLDLSSTLIVLNYCNVIGYLYVGISFPLSHYIGNALSKRDFKEYYNIIKTFFWINALIAIFESSLTIIFRHSISGFYSISDEIVEKSSFIFFLWGIFVSFDIFNIMFQAILRGAGKQKITSIWNLVMSIIWMIPCSYILAFTFKWGLVGIWSGCLSYITILCIVNAFYLYFLDLNQAIKDIEKEMDHPEELPVELIKLL